MSGWMSSKRSSLTAYERSNRTGEQYQYRTSLISNYYTMFNEKYINQEFLLAEIEKLETGYVDTAVNLLK